MFFSDIMLLYSPLISTIHENQIKLFAYWQTLYVCINIVHLQKALYMFTKRQNQYNKLMQKELAYIFTQHGKEWFRNTLVTITMIRITPDLGIAKVYVSVLPFNKSEELLEVIKNKQKAIRGMLGNRIRNQVRHIPDLIFYIDDTMDFIDRMDKIIGKT